METNQENQSNFLKQSVEDYNKVYENDIDLVNEVRKLLIGSGISQAKLDITFEVNRFIIDAKDKNSAVQKFALNRYWSQQLSFVPNSIETRFMLIMNGTVQEWLDLFTKGVLPVIIEHNLPNPIG